MKKNVGKPFPLGANCNDGGVNFSLFSPLATEVDLLLFKDENDTSPEVISLDKEINKTYYYWHIWVEGIKEGDLYAYRVNGESNERIEFDYSKVLLDPYGKSITGTLDREKAMAKGVDNIHHCLKNVVIGESQFDWEKVEHPSFSDAENIIYEVHPKGFTKSLTTSDAGSFQAIIHKIPYLKSLGINTIELLPVFFFDWQDAPPSHTNYWGYSPISFFALHSPYCYEKNPVKLLDEFRNLIKELHKNDIKIILDVVYNHTAESNNVGPTYSMKGIANTSYYHVTESGEYLDFTGCGNTINGNHSVIRRMILDSLKYWKKEFKIDGFRFDLAGVLTRDEKGKALEVPPVIWEIDSSPTLAETVLIAEPWDISGYHTTNFPGDKWSVWQDSFRDVMRKTIRGDQGMMEEFAKKITSSFIQNKNDYLDYKPQRNINFITCHDGFTMNDLVSYNEKHNWANGENNQDGSNNNISNNYGVEGETNDPLIVEIRERQIKNFMMCLLFSHGTPMITMGDEVKRTQNGNNNPYSLDEPSNWFDWKLLETNASLFQFVQQTIALRKRFTIFDYKDFFEKSPQKVKPYFLLHGTQLGKPDLSYHSHSLGIQFIYPSEKENLYFICNFYKENLEFQLPSGNWEVLQSSHKQVPKEVKNTLKVPEKSCILLRLL